MKIIDLLNKIANDEEVPKKFKIEGINRIFNYNNYEKWFDDINDKYYCKGAIELRELNDEVEILEEEKKIPEKIEYYDDSIAWVIDDVGQLSDVDKVIIDKLNDVIDYLKSKGE